MVVLVLSGVVATLGGVGPWLVLSVVVMGGVGTEWC